MDNIISLQWLSGPFLDKELRVSSRHRRNFWLRVIYVSALLFFVAMTWVNVIENSNVTFQRSRLAEVGRIITSTIVWFQFAAVQFIAVVMFCNSINDEINHRTLGVLLTTPVTSFQIIMGKLLSKMFQIILLILISLPLLAIIRIFGGVPWDYIFKSLLITLTAAIFAGSLSLFISVLCRRNYIVFIITMSILSFFYGLKNLDFFRFIRRGYPSRLYTSRSSFTHIFNPFYLFDGITQNMLSPGRSRITYEWIIYCIFYLFVSCVILLVSSHLLRKITLANVFGRKSLWKRFRENIGMAFSYSTEPKKPVSDGKIRHVWGPALAWKEMRMKFSSREKMFVAAIISIELIMIIAMYVFPYVASEYGYEEALTFYLYVFMGFGVISTVFFSVRCITNEKESQTWCSLLMTPLSDWQIITGKLVGILRRILPIWIMLGIFFCTFANLSGHGCLMIFILTILMVGLIVFLYGAGLYFGSRYKNTSAAIIAYFVLMFAIWYVIPLVVESDLTRNISRYFEFRLDIRNGSIINPFVLTQTIMTSGLQFIHQFVRWPDQTRNYMNSLILMVNIVFAYFIAGTFFAWRAKCQFRRHIF